MAVNDVVSVTITSVAAAGNLDRQPGAGVEEVIEEVYVSMSQWRPENLSAGDLHYDVTLYDGTNIAMQITGICATTETGTPASKSPMKIRITNTQYLRMTNGGSTTARIIAATGIQTA